MTITTQDIYRRANHLNKQSQEATDRQTAILRAYQERLKDSHPTVGQERVTVDHIKNHGDAVNNKQYTKPVSKEHSVTAGFHFLMMVDGQEGTQIRQMIKAKEPVEVIEEYYRNNPTFPLIQYLTHKTKDFSKKYLDKFFAFRYNRYMDLIWM